MHPPVQIEMTDDAAFGSDEASRIVLWNAAAERLLGYTAEQVLGKPCHEILCGIDIFGNRYCREQCNPRRMLRDGEPIRTFELDLRKASGEFIRAAISILIVSGPGPSQLAVVHLLKPDGLPEDVDDPPEGDQADAHEPEVAPAASSSSEARPRLTPREVEVLRLLGVGASVAEIADSLSISVATVRTHSQNILNKLSARNVREAISRARANRLI